MLKKIKLAAIFLVIPVICFFALEVAVSNQEEEWNHELRQNVPATRVAELALPVVCYRASIPNSVDLAPVCGPYTNTRRLIPVALSIGTGAVLFAGLLMLAGIRSKANRRILLRVFRPGFVITNIVVAAFLILQGVLLSGTVLYAGYDGVWGGDFYFYAVLIGLITLAGVFFTIKPLFKATRAQSIVVGRSVSVTQCPKLWQFVESLSDKVGCSRPQNLVLGLTPEFFVTEADVHCIDGKLTGRTMYISVPLCRLLKVEELSAVIAHELGHFKGADTAFSLHFYPIYRGTVDSIHGVSQTATQITQFGRYIPIAGFKILAVLGSLTLFPSLYMLGFFLECFEEAEKAISREREIAADAVAADVTSAGNISVALVKIVAFTGMWDRVAAWMQNALVDRHLDINGQRYDARQFFANVSEVFSLTVASSAEPNALAGLDAKTIPHPTDSRPPLSIRLAALGKTLDDLRSDALDLSPSPSSNEVIDNCEALEMQLSVIEQALLCPEQARSNASPSEAVSIPS